MSSDLLDRSPEAESSPSRVMSPGTTRGRRTLFGVALLIGIFALALFVVEVPNLDTVRQDVADATTGTVASGRPIDEIQNCFQGFCFGDDVGYLERWWRFSTAFLELMAWGIVLAIAAAGIVQSLIVPGRDTGSPRPLYPASVAMVILLFSPIVTAARIGLGLLAAAALALSYGRRGPEPDDPEEPPSSWSQVARSGLADASKAGGRLALRLVPLFVVAGFLGGLGAQHLTEDGVTAIVGDHLLGVAVAAAVGLLLPLPRLFEIPLAAAALLVGTGRIPAAVLMAAATVALPRSLPRLKAAGRRVAAGVAALSLVAIGGGAAALGLAAVVDPAEEPTIAFDGTACTYTGPESLPARVTDFTVRNDAVDEDFGESIAVMVGRLPDNVSLDHFAVTVAADPRAPMPAWFTEVALHDFIFPDTVKTLPFPFHREGNYAAVCLDGGGFYVVREFSMPQPTGWFEEFRNQYHAHVADEVIRVEG